MHLDRDGWSFTALFSNTALAHDLRRTDDWVVIYFGRPGGPEHQRTAVTETRGPLEGRRVVRGRETECLKHYSQILGNWPCLSATTRERRLQACGNPCGRGDGISFLQRKIPGTLVFH